MNNELIEKYFKEIPNGGIKIGKVDYLPYMVSRLHLGESISIDYTKPKPNRWYRFWYKFLLNWTWTDLPKEQ